jgi:hypothetical protein
MIVFLFVLCWCGESESLLQRNILIYLDSHARQKSFPLRSSQESNYKCVEAQEASTKVAETTAMHTRKTNIRNKNAGNGPVLADPRETERESK